LEREGVFTSRAVGKGVPGTSAIKRLAIRVEDCGLACGDSERLPPEGNYGAGEIRALGEAACAVKEWFGQRILFLRNGMEVARFFSLFRFSHGKPNEWLFIKRSEKS